MEESGEENLDGSSILPVSSLRSRFEQMATTPTTTNSAPTPRAISPKSNATSTQPRAISPKTKDPLFSSRSNTSPSTARSSLDGVGTDQAWAVRGRERVTAGTNGLRPPSLYSPGPVSSSPTRSPRQRPVSTGPGFAGSHPPAVTVEPPRSPPKARHKSSIEALSLLSTEPSKTASSSGSSSPRHFRIPSRSATPLVETRKPSASPSILPPEPPPPRRSGEIRRDSTIRSSLGPPVNRAEKPKLPSKPASLGGDHFEIPSLPPSSMRTALRDAASPFSTPPGSNSGSPEPEEHPPPLPPGRPNLPLSSKPSFMGNGCSEPPPLHHSISSRRREPDSYKNGVRSLAPQLTGDQRAMKPVLPSRPESQFEVPKPRLVHAQSNGHTPVIRSHLNPQNPIVSHHTGGRDEFRAPPPKRISSNPTSQAQATERSHARSMTVDRTTSRVPAEFRSVPQTVISRTEVQAYPQSAGSQSLPANKVQHSTEYPDATRANRRPPYFKKGVRDIPIKYDTRCFDVCGELVCTTGHFTRVWSVVDGDLLMSLAHGETIKILSMVFKPANDIDEEGARLWLGTNFGEIQEVDILTQSLVASKPGAHTRREIIKMYRHGNEIWSLDDSGTLHLWAPDTSGTPNLSSNPTQSFRLPKGHTFSMIASHELWHATGKDLRIFRPTPDGSRQFQVLQRPLSQPGVGEVTSGTVLQIHPDRVYFGHNDGKVTIYARDDYACLGIVNVSSYKINNLTSAGNFLWAGFNTGMIYVYDTSTTPWTVRKDWRAHDNPVVGLIADRSSFWKLDRLQVVSLGADNVIRPWDGMLQEDWLENEMQSQDHRFCNFQQIRTLVMTWNAGASTPSSLRSSESDAAFFPELLRSSNSPDILVFGFQELVDLEDKKTTAKSFFKSKKKDSSEPEHMSHQYRDWRDYLTRCLDDYMPQNELYHLLHTASLVGLFTCVFVKASLRDRVSKVSGAEVKRGMGGLHGNKGALILRFTLDDTSMCFVNCHLAAGQTQTMNRNNDISAILEGSVFAAEREATLRQDSFVGGGDGSMILDHEICVLNGDLNYRIDTMSRDTVVNAVKANNLAKLLQRDQLLLSRRKNPGFRLRAFHELPITFAPTYKYDVGTDNYDTSEKRRSPAWCDRLLYRGGDRIEQLDYQRHEVRVSDHRPVTGLFNMLIKTVSPKKRAVIWDECQRRFEEMKMEMAHESRIDFLHNICALDAQSSEKLSAARWRSD